MPEISQKLISIFSHGILSGIAVVVLMIAWGAFSRRHLKFPKPHAGLLIATVFIILELILRPARFIPHTGLLLIVIVLALWLTGSIFYWNNLSFAMLPLSMSGTFLTVPDTENVALLLGILIPTTLFAWPLHRIPTHIRADAAGLGAIAAWVICVDGQGRPPSIIVSLGCLGLLMIVPLLRVWRGPRAFSMTRSGWLSILLHALSIAIALGLARTTAQMVVAAIGALTALGIAAIAVRMLSKTYYSEVEGD